MVKHSRLDGFYFVMTTGSISAAARALLVSQPTVSRLIRELENESQLELFVRKQGRVYPNAAAHELFAAVEKQYSALRSIDETIERLAGRPQKVIGIASLPSFASSVLPKALADPSLATSEFAIQTIENDQVTGFLGSQPEFLCISSDLTRDPTIMTEILVEADLLCGLPINHPLTEKSMISIKDLAGVSLARAEGAAVVFNQIDVVLERSGVSPVTHFRSNRSDILYSLIENTGCCAIVEPFGYFKCNRAAVAIRPLELSLPIIYRFASMPFSRKDHNLETVKRVIRRTAEKMLHEVRRAAQPRSL